MPRKPWLFGSGALVLDVVRRLVLKFAHRPFRKRRDDRFDL
jgi:hypothetical protein